MSLSLTLPSAPKTKQDARSVVATVSLELNVFGEPVCFEIKVEDKQARLSDIVPLARAISSRLVAATMDGFVAVGKSVPCRKGCAACCHYLVPLSVPEAFRLTEELSATSADEGGKLIKSSLDAARTILDGLPGDFRRGETSQEDCGIRSRQLSDWYAGLGLACPFLSDNLCVHYEQRPIACREHTVTGSAISCGTASTCEPAVVKMPVSVLECLGQLTAELEQSDVEAVMLPLALPWAQENMERLRQSWPAVSMVERLVEILETTAAASASAPQP